MKSTITPIQLLTTPYTVQQPVWPSSGRHIMAQYDETSIVVYQAFSPEIGQYAARHNHFGGPAFSLNRMSWIKPNFLWMMHRCGWSTKPDQEITLAIRLHRHAFDEVLAQAVHSSYVPEIYPTESGWRTAVKSSAVRLQWDPDHDPSGLPLRRRAIQIGLRGETLAKYAREWIISVEDITDFARAQAANARRSPYSDLVMPAEQPYPVADPATARKLQLSELPSL